MTMCLTPEALSDHGYLLLSIKPCIEPEPVMVSVSPFTEKLMPAPTEAEPVLSARLSAFSLSPADTLGSV